MPCSNWCGLDHCVRFLVRCDPRSVLDVGVGFGKWGFLARLYLDVYHKRWRREDWRVVIDGVEVFGPYLGEHQRAIYDDLAVGDVTALVGSLRRYDLIIAGDVLEHIPKAEAMRLVERLRAKAGALMFGIPCGPGWGRAGTAENPREAHVSAWTPGDLPWMEAEMFRAPSGLDYGIFTWRER